MEKSVVARSTRPQLMEDEADDPPKACARELDEEGEEGYQDQAEVWKRERKREHRRVEAERRF